MVSEHVNVKEAYALLESSQLYCTTQSLEIKGSTVVVDVGNMTVFHTFKKGKLKNAQLHELITKLFWLQVNEDFTLNLRCDRQKNKEASGLSRSEEEDYVRQSEDVFNRLWRE